MGIIKETDNITLNVYWKGWKKSTVKPKGGPTAYPHRFPQIFRTMNACF